MSGGISLYLHIPFCRQKCGYCSFVSHAGREADISAYVEALKKELTLRVAGNCLNTVYFGGGTPSLLAHEQLNDIMSTIHSLCPVDKDAEITIEANPGTVDEAYLAVVRKLGINRLSLGMQSLDDTGLVMLGRIHSAAEAREAVQFARNAGFANLNVDLIYSLPGQSLASWKKTLKGVVELAPEHISLYPLTLEGDEPICVAIERGELSSLNPDLAAEHYELAEDLLAAHGYGHYEISNWAKQGYECRHNLVYWQGLPYIGAGVAAHSYIDGHRCANTADLDEYLNAFRGGSRTALDWDEEISPELRLAEAVILGLRLSRGISPGSIRSRFGMDLLGRYGKQVDALAGLGLLESVDDNIRLTRRGRLLGNEVFWRFLPAERAI